MGEDQVAGDGAEVLVEALASADALEDFVLPSAQKVVDAVVKLAD